MAERTSGTAPQRRADSWLSRRTVEQVTAALDGCNHPMVSPDAGHWWCETCGQMFGPIFTETPRRNGDPSIKEAMTRG